MTSDIRVEHRDAGAASVCEAILATVPHWFGMAEANAEYARQADENPTFVATTDGSDVGFLTVLNHSEHVAEVLVMAVIPSLHRRGVGAALLAAAEAHVGDQGCEFLQVKTLSSAQPDAGYEKTRAFYLAQGFRIFEEMPDLWGPDNPAVVMVKSVCS